MQTHTRNVLFYILLALPLGLASAAQGDDLGPAIDAALKRAGANRPQIEEALSKVPAEQQEGMRFLVAHMPDQDLTSLSAEFLLVNVRYAYQAFNEAPWKDQVPKEVFLNYVLPYASINERRDDWRKDFYEKFKPLIAGITESGKAGAKLNEKVFPLVKVRFSRNRQKADQSPLESIETGMASCTGMSVLLVDACRAVGVPARFVGVPLWSDLSGNHSWVEIFDNGQWHFTGAGEATGDKLNVAWFVGRASGCERDNLLHAIYAARFERSAQKFPLPWAQDVDWVNAVNVTDRYTNKVPKPADGEVIARFQVLDRPGGQRISTVLRLRDPEGKQVFEGKTRDERFDGNDHLETVLKKGTRYQAEIAVMDKRATAEIQPQQAEELFTLTMAGAEQKLPTWLRPTHDDLTFAKSPEGREVLAAMAKYFAADPEKRADIALDPKFDERVLTNSASIRKLAWAAYSQGVEAKKLIEDLKQQRVTYKEFTCPFAVKAVGTMPEDGWPLFIAMHGGGGAPKEVNDQQWQVMQIYYRDQPQAGGYLYLAIRAPNDRWNGFYDWYNLPLTENLIRQFVLAAGVNPNKVCLMGYSHGGYGAFFIGPQIADRFAAVHASAAAPATGNEVGKNLFNTRFSFMVGEKDNAHGRYERCVAFDKYINELRGDRKNSYPVKFELIQGAPHTGLPDRNKIKDMIDAVRVPVPREVCWQTTYDVVKSMNWVQVPKAGGGKELTAKCQDNTVTVEGKNLDEVTLLLDERLVDFAKPLTVETGGEKTTHTLRPSLRTLCETLADRGDPELMFAARVDVKMPQKK